MIAPDVVLGKDVVIPQLELVNLYGCTLGDQCKIASFVEIQCGVVLGRNVKVEAFAFIPTGVTIEDGVFIGPHVCFTNDRTPRAVGAAIGANATILSGITIGEGALVGAGATVTRDVSPHALVIGNPARVVGRRAASYPIRDSLPSRLVLVSPLFDNAHFL